jgi:PAS domain S-box-containing protein
MNAKRVSDASAISAVDAGLFGALGDTVFELGAADDPEACRDVAPLAGRSPPPDGERTRAAVAAIRAGQGTQTFEYIGHTAAGPRHFEARLAVSRRGSVLMVVRDISAWSAERSRLLESETRFRTMADHAPVLLWMAGADGRCNFFNQGWLEFTGRPLARELGSGWAEGVHFEDLQNTMHVYLAAFVQRRPFHMEYRLRRADGEYRWILDSGVPRYGPEFEGYVGSCIDITALKNAQKMMSQFNLELEERVRRRTGELDAALRDKEVLMHEIHHRVKNNLQVISSLLNLQVRHFAGTSTPDVQRVRDAFLDCQGRVHSIALVHQNLSQTTHLARLDMSGYLGELVSMILNAIGGAPNVQVETDVNPLWLGLDQAVPCGLLVHELLTNALKHAFRNGRRGKVRLALQRQPPRSLSLTVEDDGVGMAPTLNLDRPPSMGLELVTALARQLRADLRIDREGGTAFRLVFPDASEHGRDGDGKE